MKIFRVLLSLALLTSSVIGYSATNDIYNLNVTPRSIDTIAFNVDDSNGTSAFSITNTGLVTIAGSFSVGALVSTSGAVISGADTSINENSNFATNINTGTSTGTVTIGGGSNAIIVNALPLTVTGHSTFITGASFNGDIGIANGISINEPSPGAIVWEGSIADANNTTLQVSNPTAVRTVTLPDESGSIPLFQAGFSATKLWVANDTVVNGATSQITPMAGVTATSNCVATANNVATNSVFIRAVTPGVDQVVLTTSGDPGASGLDYTVVCSE